MRTSFLCNLLLFYGGRKEDPSSLDSGPFLPIILGEGGSYFGMDDLFFPFCNCLPDRNAIKRTFLLSQGRLGLFMDVLMFVEWRSGRSCQSEK